jgi:hypothetical protein
LRYCRMTKRPLREWSTEELERRLESSLKFDTAAEMAEAKRILRERHALPDRNLQRWILAVAIGSLVATVLTWFLI